VVWKGLSPEQQRVLQEAAEESVTYQRKIWAEAELKDLQTVQEQGAKIVRPDKGPFRESVRPIWRNSKAPRSDLIEQSRRYNEIPAILKTVLTVRWMLAWS
jgi:TRAP-type C4-dicarboxylate transport system substrate-binding protein